jgi:DNA-binding MarR family transcriptional regulator
LVEKASLTSVLDAMHNKGLIKRKRSPVDRRRLDIFLTAIGRRLESELLPLGKKINNQAIQGLSDREIEQLHSLIGRAVKNLQS